MPLHAVFEQGAWVACAPANIALIKYMGKVSSEENIPTNSSLSYTLPEYYTKVSVRPAAYDQWQRLAGYQDPGLSKQAVARYLAHLAWLKAQLGYTEGLAVASANSFPASCGLASSASSFAALTVAAVAAMGHQVPYETLIAWSRRGSGSSCRSFYGPWVSWVEQQVTPLNLDCTFTHQVLLLDTSVKSVSSSQAHQQVQQLDLSSRISAVAHRQAQLLALLALAQWQSVFELVWQEFWEMHQLFWQCGFTYWGPKTYQALSLVHSYWQMHGCGPIVTVDAGPNIHLLTPTGQAYPQLLAQLAEVGVLR